jgi:hypothetical protein
MIPIELADKCFKLSYYLMLPDFTDKLLDLEITYKRLYKKLEDILGKEITEEIQIRQNEWKCEIWERVFDANFWKTYTENVINKRTLIYQIRNINKQRIEDYWNDIKTELNHSDD